MDKSQIFKKAHEITKKVIQPGDSYQVTFAAALREIYSSLKEKTSMNHIDQIQQLAEILNSDSDLRASVWQRGNNNRIYIKAASQRGAFMDAGYLDVTADKADFVESGLRASRWASSSISALDKTLVAAGFVVNN